MDAPTPKGQGFLLAVELRVERAGALSADSRRRLLSLFEGSYEQADPTYLERSLALLRYVATAWRAGELVGFALGETRQIDLPELPAQPVGLAGLACVAPEMRRRRLFTELGRLAMAGESPPPGGRYLVCGRVAHAAALRTITQFPTAVPRPGQRPTLRQQAIGRIIAQAYGVRRFDPTTFVCVGEGTPVGYPRVELDVTPEEASLFRPVNRDRGDSLLAMAWIPDAPTGW